jgi:4-hydroxy-3-methylbut-2-en-1-yl diphosphate reductase
MNREIKIAKTLGFCFGVKRAIKMVEETQNNLNILGNLIHNKQVVEELNKQGKTSIDSIENANQKTIVITAHGISDQKKDEIKKKGYKIIDTTCPLVQEVHDTAKKLKKENRFIIIIGDKNHKEVKAIKENIGDCLIVQDHDSVQKNIEIIKNKKLIGIISQTTQNLHTAEKLAETIKKINPNTIFKNTICSATKEKQDAARELAHESDLMIIIGGYHSANTKRLAEICAKITKTFHIETKNDLKEEWFIGKKQIGISAGASTPNFIITEVIKAIEDIKEF